MCRIKMKQCKQTCKSITAYLLFHQVGDEKYGQVVDLHIEHGSLGRSDFLEEMEILGNIQIKS